MYFVNKLHSINIVQQILETMKNRLRPLQDCAWSDWQHVASPDQTLLKGAQGECGATLVFESHLQTDRH